MRGELISWSASLHLPLLSSRLLAASFKSSSPSLSIHTLLSPLEFEIGSLMLYDIEELFVLFSLFGFNITSEIAPKTRHTRPHYSNAMAILSFLAANEVMTRLMRGERVPKRSTP